MEHKISESEAKVLIGDRTACDIWQYIRMVLISKGYEKYHAEVNHRVNHNGYTFWHVNLLGPRNEPAFDTKHWACWKDMLNELTEWINSRPPVPGLIPHELYFDKLSPNWDDIGGFYVEHSS